MLLGENCRIVCIFNSFISKNSKLAEKNKTKLDAFKDLHIKLQDDIKK